MEKRSDGVTTYAAADVEAWKEWLSNHHATQKSVWLIIYHQESSTPSITYPEAVDEALCWGWVDSKPNKRDHESYFQYFSKRNPNSNWSRVNKEKIERLMSEGRIHPPGKAIIEQAKARGTWDSLNDIEDGVIPEDLRTAFEKYPGSGIHFGQFPPSTRRGILEWIHNAQRPATREKRIEETARLAAENKRANQWPKVED